MYLLNSDWMHSSIVQRPKFKGQKERSCEIAAKTASFYIKEQTLENIALSCMKGPDLKEQEHLK